MAKKELWIGRERDTGEYGIYQGEPTHKDLGYTDYRLSLGEYQSGAHGLIDHFCPEVFHALTTVRLRKGRKRKIKRIVIELEG